MEGQKPRIHGHCRPKCKLWLEKEGHVVFGEGRMALLQAIDESGSINRAAAMLNMSYRAAWGKIKATEQRLGFAVVEKHIGGVLSGSELTVEAKKLMASYAGFRDESIEAVESLFDKYFNGYNIKNG